MSITHVIISFQAKPESTVAFSSILEQVKATLPTIPGCLAVRCFGDSQDPTRFTLVEDWESPALHQQHISKVIESGAWASMAAHLAEAPVSGYFNLL